MLDTLKTIFQNTADAIREKNGETEAMKPSMFAEAIRAIQTGGGSGESELPITFTAGIREVSSSESKGAVFTHNLGVLPDVIVLFAFGDTGDYEISCALVVSQYIKDLCPELPYGTSVSQKNSGCQMKGGWDTSGGTNAMVYQMMGGPYDVNENSFTFGYTNHLLRAGKYSYFVLGRSEQ